MRLVKRVRLAARAYKLLRDLDVRNVSLVYHEVFVKLPNDQWVELAEWRRRQRGSQ